METNPSEFCLRKSFWELWSNFRGILFVSSFLWQIRQFFFWWVTLKYRQKQLAVFVGLSVQLNKIFLIICFLWTFDASDSWLAYTFGYALNKEVTDAHKVPERGECFLVLLWWSLERGGRHDESPVQRFQLTQDNLQRVSVVLALQFDVGAVRPVHYRGDQQRLRTSVHDHNSEVYLKLLKNLSQLSHIGVVQHCQRPHFKRVLQPFSTFLEERVCTKNDKTEQILTLIWKLLHLEDLFLWTAMQEKLSWFESLIWAVFHSLNLFACNFLSWWYTLIFADKICCISCNFGQLHHRPVARYPVSWFSSSYTLYIMQLWPIARYTSMLVIFEQYSRPVLRIVSTENFGYGQKSD